jgi:hypothetical protein
MAGKTLHAQPTLHMKQTFQKRNSTKICMTQYFFEMEENIFTIICQKKALSNTKKMCGSAVR